jgi:5'-nucleotidase
MKRPIRRPIFMTSAFLAVLLSVLSFVSCGESGRGDRAKPVEMTILFSSDLLGKIRSCGCTVDDSGGLGRRATYVEGIRADNEHVIILDVGDAFSIDLSYSQKEADLTWDVFNLMRLDAFTPGETDFVFGLPYLQNLAERAEFDIIAANIVEADTGEPLFGSRYKVIDIGGVKVGITGVLDDSIRFPGYIETSSFRIEPAAETLSQLVPDMGKEADFLILLSHMGRERSMDLAREVPGFDLVVVGHGKPVIKQLEKVGETVLVAAGGAGQYIGKMNLSLGPDGEMVKSYFQLVALKEEIKVHDSVRHLFDLYELDLTDKGRKSRKH